MSKSGYIYVLINPLMQGLVKIGKTHRNPDERAQELSSATGVPANFIVAFQEYFNNCDWAEKVIHLQLSKGNFRISNNREFFSAPLNAVVRVILEIKKQDLDDNANDLEDNDLSNEDDIENVVLNLLLEGYSCFTGVKDANLFKGYYEVINYHEEKEKLLSEFDNDDHSIPINYKKSFELFAKASELGCGDADMMLGFMWLHGKGCYPSLKNAIKAFELAGDRGDCSAWMELSKIYSFWNKNLEKAYFYLNKYVESDDYGDSYYFWAEVARLWDQKEFYAEHLWENFFQSEGFFSKDKSNEDLHRDAELCVSYLEARIDYVNRKINPVFSRYINRYSEEIIEICRVYMENIENSEEIKQYDKYSASYTYQKIIRMVERNK